MDDRPPELFHALAEPESAAARRLVRDLGLLEAVTFRNVAFDSHRAALAAAGGARTPALLDSDGLHEGIDAIGAALARRARR
ncbi:MAG TPA: hypothetical protein VFL83_09990 [Anaeromyxobacter sp.]|nr:hypothetical protein [Anaeromyxobacter sp.]